MSHLSLYFFGSPLIELDGVEVAVDRKKAIALLAYLAISRTSHNRNNLAALLWPSYDQTRARASLRYTISLLRKTLGEEWFDVDRERIGLNRSERLQLDVDVFHTLLAGCRGHNHKGDEVCPDCTSPLTEAVGIYRDDFMTGFGLKDSPEFDDWQFLQAQGLHHELGGVLEKLVQCQVAEGEFEGAIGYSKRWLELDGGNEAAHRRLMESYALAGQRTKALRQFRECERILKEEMGVSPQEETVRLFQAIKENVFPTGEASPTESESEVAEDAPPDKPPDTPKHNLPRQLTSFIGRKDEIEDVKTLLSTTYLLTLTGSGGCGKTRLALKVAADLVEEYDNGVWLVELASLSDPELVPQEIASALEVSEQPGRSFSDTLSDYLRTKQTLLMLDNCEHLIESCATLVDTLLSACPNLKILTASREGLGIGGELTYQVPSLSTPQPDQPPTLENIGEYEALSLFTERALFSQPTFEVTDANTQALAQICHRLDGIPLAIELAAARVKALSVEQILTRLDDRFRLLTGGSRTALPRQQTLRATIDWSYNQLSEKEMVLFNRLSVFMGGWRLEAAEAVCSGEGIEEYEVLDLLIDLVDKSLVVAEGIPSIEKASSVEEDSSMGKGSGEVRYSLLETIRQYARDKLLESDEAATLRGDHLEWYLGLAERAEPELSGPDQMVWFDRFEVELDNLRAALRWSLGSGPFLPKGDEVGARHAVRASTGVGARAQSLGQGTDIPLRLAGALYQFWLVRTYLSEGYEWLEEALSQSSGTLDSVRGKALYKAGLLAWGYGDISRMSALGEESLALFRQLGDKGGIGWSLIVLAISVGIEQGDYDRKKVLLEESLSLFREWGDKLGIVWSLTHLGGVAEIQGDYKGAEALLEESLSLSREMGDKFGVAFKLVNLGNIVLSQGDYGRGAKLLEEGLILARELKNKLGTASSLRSLGQVAQYQGDYERAGALHKESLALYREIGSKTGSAKGLERFAEVALAQGQPEQAARLLGAAEALRQASNNPSEPFERSDVDRSVAAVRAELGEESFKTAWEKGRAMSMEKAINYAMKVETP